MWIRPFRKVPVVTITADDRYCTPIVGLDPDDPVVLNKELLDRPLLHIQARLLFNRFLHGEPVPLLVGLGTRAVNSRALAPVQGAELDAGPVDDLRHLAAKRVDLLHEVPLGQAADGRVAGHERDAVEVHGEHERGAAHARGSQRGLAPGMARADHDDVVCIVEET